MNVNAQLATAVIAIMPKATMTDMLAALIIAERHRGEPTHDDFMEAWIMNGVVPTKAEHVASIAQSIVWWIEAQRDEDEFIAEMDAEIKARGA